ncbi:glycosyltransferase family 2 protein [Pseudomonas sp. MYb185]|uniref:glycosyltransferase family 2 protein n=1 Tax=Pseudomonas sp. MYb185 TaxID=1848729 RepID=UPI000CFAE623|nr:glycosyltransferase family 2 protein [Pseudomonas sp. MYb185]PRB75441.1 hypothetical protein CQ007_17945 [Pseudomonas sp. MYb185]
MLNPTFSVVIPTCDRPEYLREAVSSVLAQTLPAHEIIIVDNGREAVDSAQLPVSEKLQVIRALPRFGVAQARNLGAILSTGDYIAFLDDDDGWDAGYLQSVLLTVEESGAEIVLGRLRDGKTGTPISGKQASFNGRDDLIRQILRRNPGAVGSNTIVKRACFAETAGFDPLITTNEDKALIFDLLSKGAQAVRAQDAWVQFRNDGEGPRLTDLHKRIEGRDRFFRKYRHQMSTGDRLFNMIQLVRLRLQHWFRRS